MSILWLTIPSVSRSVVGWAAFSSNQKELSSWPTVVKSLVMKLPTPPRRETGGETRTPFSFYLFIYLFYRIRNMR